MMKIIQIFVLIGAILFAMSSICNGQNQITGHEALMRWVNAPDLESNQCLIFDFIQENEVIMKDGSSEVQTDVCHLIATNNKSLFRTEDHIVYEDTKSTLSISPESKKILFMNSGRSVTKPMILSRMDEYYDKLCQVMHSEELTYQAPHWVLEVMISESDNVKSIKKLEFFFSDIEDKPNAMVMYYNHSSIKRAKISIERYEITDEIPEELMESVDSFIYKSGELKEEYKNYKVRDVRDTNTP